MTSKSTALKHMHGVQSNPLPQGSAAHLKPRSDSTSIRMSTACGCVRSSGDCVRYSAAPARLLCLSTGITSASISLAGGRKGRAGRVLSETPPDWALLACKVGHNNLRSLQSCGTATRPIHRITSTGSLLPPMQHSCSTARKHPPSQAAVQAHLMTSENSLLSRLQ